YPEPGKTGEGFDIRIFILECRGHWHCHESSNGSLPGNIEITFNAVHPLVVGTVPVEGKFILHIEKDKYCACNTYCRSDNIQDRVELVFDDVAPCGNKVAL